MSALLIAIGDSDCLSLCTGTFIQQQTADNQTLTRYLSDATGLPHMTITYPWIVYANINGPN